ncbi:hypothetical protein [Pedobacter psychroterrae]|uniref:Lipocalin-like protein n=1 Tax=Pedobacter psychroterrae TaxID=2530453 RepID=A0A4R0NKX6_9SPHI|nr:hypothetical protein [Pedobacter psychroterrae]TCD01442.1 hypothetical protein EZ437_11920 [Pedobacter psychroterrae]
MKRIFLIAAILCSSLMVLQSCSPKGASTPSVKRGNVTGNWTINDITFEGMSQSAVKSLFDDGPYTCFVGSTWNLTNSGNGSYTLPGGTGCTAKTQTIFWSASAGDQTFQFKKIFEGDKAKNVTSGYRMVLTATDGDTMVIKVPVDNGNSPAYIVLNFVKAAK